MADTPNAEIDIQKLWSEGSPQSNPAPVHQVTAIRMSMESNAVHLIFQSSKHYLLHGGPTEVIEAIRAEPEVILSMSPQTAKDLTVLLVDQVGQFEATYGTINTAYTMRRAAEDKTAQGKSGT